MTYGGQPVPASPTPPRPGPPEAHGAGADAQATEGAGRTSPQGTQVAWDLDMVMSGPPETISCEHYRQ